MAKAKTAKVISPVEPVEAEPDNRSIDERVADLEAQWKFISEKYFSSDLAKLQAIKDAVNNV